MFYGRRCRDLLTVKYRGNVLRLQTRSMTILMQSILLIQSPKSIDSVPSLSCAMVVSLFRKSRGKRRILDDRAAVKFLQRFLPTENGQPMTSYLNVSFRFDINFV